MPDNGDDQRSSDDLIRKAKKRLDGVEDDVPTTEAPPEADESLSDGTTDQWAEMLANMSEEAVDQRGDTPPTNDPVVAPDGWEFRQSKAAIRTAAVLLLVGTLWGVVVTASTGLSDTGGYTAYIIDVGLAISLLMGKTWARIWTLIRAVGGLVFVGVLSLPSGDYSTFVLQAGFAVALGLLLLLTPSSTPRIAGAVAVLGGAVLVSVWLGGAPLPSNLEAGDCFNLPGGFGVAQDVIISLPEVSCVDPHDGEIIELLTFSAGSSAPYPGEESVSIEAFVECAPGYEDYVGVASGVKVIDLFVIFPVESAWNQGDREVTCATQHVAGEKTAGSVRGEGANLSNACIDGSLQTLTPTLVDCSQSHTFELFASLEHPAGQESGYPSDMSEYAEGECILRFNEFIGIPYEDSVFEVWWVEPVPETWNVGDRQVICIVGRLDQQQSTGTAEGSEA